MGDGGVGGEGGGGGDSVTVEISREELQALRNAGFERVEFRVGQGGQEGGPGEDTIANFVTADGTVLRSIVARGGKPGRAGQRSDPSARQATLADVEKGLQLSTVTLADCVHVRGGLFYLLGAGWEVYEVSTSL